ncbi:hypothetical protein DITRI_Ditri01bG0060800 [Diplodiscus trichospermus]
MADDLCFFNKDSFILKSPKKSLLVLRMVVLLFVMVCGVFICSICLRQISISSTSEFLNIGVIQKPCPEPNIEPWEIPYVHYPNPKTYSRAECACNPVRYFAIMSMQRSGSGWFETLLNNHTNISSNGEIFSVKVRRSNVSTIFETLDKIYNLDWVSSASKNECTAAVGLKWMLNQGLMQHHKELVEYFNTRGVSAIFLFRRNLLRRMISILANSYDRDAKLLNGTHKSHVHSPREAEILASYKPVINATLLIPNIRQIEETTKKALEYFKSTRHIILYYEDVVKNRTKLDEVQEFLKVPRRELRSRQVKIHKGALSNHFQNWDDVKKALNGTHFPFSFSRLPLNAERKKNTQSLRSGCYQYIKMQSTDAPDLNSKQQQQQQQQQQPQQQSSQQLQQPQWVPNQWMGAMQYPTAAMVMMQQQMMMYPHHYMPYNNHHFQYQQYQHQQQQKQQHSYLQKQQQGSNSDEVKTIWVGDLVHWMDETYLHGCFSHTGEVSSVKIIRNKQTGQSEGYGFVEFHSRATAEKVLQNYNGSLMPNTEQPFRLNWASFSMNERRSDAGSDLSIFVGDLAMDVTDTILHETFSSRFQSVKGAKVVIDSNTGRSKGYGFVRFGDENEKSRAMTEMNGVYCLSRPMRVGVATPKKASGYQQQYSSQALVLAGGHASNGAVAQGFQSDNESNNATIFVGGLDSDVSDDDLRQPFSQFGEIISVKIPHGKGCGFVQFANRKNAEEAIQSLNGTNIGKQTVRLSWGRNIGNKQGRGDSGNQWNGRYYRGQGYGGYGYGYYAAAAVPGAS